VRVVPVLEPRDARARFAALVRGPDEQLDLALGALLIAAEAEPVDVELELRRLDELAALARPEVERAGADPVARVRALADSVYGALALRGNTEVYDDPRNSYLNEVLDRGLGLPITLAIVLVEVARRAGVALVGVGFPGHFLVRSLESDLVLDPFDGARPLDERDLRALLARTTGGAVPFGRGLLAPAPPREVLARILRNLLGSFLARRDTASALAAVERLALIDRDQPELVRDRGLLRLAVGRLAPAARDLRRYLARCPEAPDAQAVRARLADARRRLWELN
jgi:regulator of sirC expression with transglutaminase-like and TPR domain